MIVDSILFWMEWSFAFMMGSAIGSFLNVCIDRIPLKHLTETEKNNLLTSNQLSSRFKEHLQQGTFSVATPKRSFCFACGTQLKWYENIPFLSAILGRCACRYCGVQYGMRSPLVELGTGLCFGAIYGQWKWGALTAIGWLNLSILIVISLTYWKHHQLFPELKWATACIAGVDLLYLSYSVLRVS